MESRSSDNSADRSADAGETGSSTVSESSSSEEAAADERQDPSDKNPESPDPSADSESVSRSTAETSSYSSDDEKNAAADEGSKQTEDSDKTVSGDSENDSEVSVNDLIILSDPWNYYYEDMLADTQTLSLLYPELFTYDSLGTTADGRELMHYVVGSPDAEKQVFINAGTHAREYLTCQLVMKQMAVYLGKVYGYEYYGDVSYRDMWEHVAVHVVPMVNPDGIVISQKGLDGLWHEEIRQTVLDIAAMDGTDANEYYLQTWKANALGTDLNRNFDAYWEEYNDPVGHPSSSHYKGEYPGSAVESQALMTLTENSSFLRTISYHTQGQVIYWRFYNIDLIYEEAASFTAALSNETGYYPWDEYETVDPAGYSDYGIYRALVPSVTMECGYGEPPYMQEQFPQIWEENKNIWEVTVLSVY